MREYYSQIRFTIFSVEADLQMLCRQIADGAPAGGGVMIGTDGLCAHAENAERCTGLGFWTGLTKIHKIGVWLNCHRC
jgi:hypothetical protein